jgi:chitin disaccharide deacetylase
MRSRLFTFLSMALLLASLPSRLPAQTAPGQADGIILLVRADDIGSSHAANLACIESYRNGIARDVEVMVPCAWFPEAVRMLRENPGLDVGVHLTLTSEWENMKWGPVTCSPSLTDSQGYFFPMVWKNQNFPPASSIQEASCNLGDIERELRGQIETAVRLIPQVSHISSHMGFNGLDSSIQGVYSRLEKEYGLLIETPVEPKWFNGFGKAKTLEDKIANFAAELENLKPGLYIHVEHPAMDTPEMRAIGHRGYYTVAEERDAVTKVFTSDRVKEAVRKKGIRLIGYKDLRSIHP